MLLRRLPEEVLRPDGRFYGSLTLRLCSLKVADCGEATGESASACGIGQGLTMGRVGFVRFFRPRVQRGKGRTHSSKKVIGRCVPGW